MERFPAGHFPSAEAERRTQERQCPYLRLLVGVLPVEDAKQFVRQHGAHTGAPLRGKRPRFLQEALIDGEGDVPLHVPDFILHVKYVNGTEGGRINGRPRPGGKRGERMRPQSGVGKLKHAPPKASDFAGRRPVCPTYFSARSKKSTVICCNWREATPVTPWDFCRSEEHTSE